MSSPGKKVFTFAMWMMLIPLAALVLLMLMLNGFFALLA